MSVGGKVLLDIIPPLPAGVSRPRGTSITYVTAVLSGVGVFLLSGLGSINVLIALVGFVFAAKGSYFGRLVAGVFGAIVGLSGALVAYAVTVPRAPGGLIAYGQNLFPAQHLVLAVPFVVFSVAQTVCAFLLHASPSTRFFIEVAGARAMRRNAN